MSLLSNKIGVADLADVSIVALLPNRRQKLVEFFGIFPIVADFVRGGHPGLTDAIVAVPLSSGYPREQDLADLFCLFRRIHRQFRACSPGHEDPHPILHKA